MTLHKVVIEGYLLRRRDLQRTRFVLGIVNCESRIATLTIPSRDLLAEPQLQTILLQMSLV
jgi:hypothetical protein